MLLFVHCAPTMKIIYSEGFMSKIVIKLCNSYAMANEGLWNITIQIPRAKPEG